MTSGDLFHHWEHSITHIQYSQLGKITGDTIHKRGRTFQLNHPFSSMTLSNDLILSPQVTLGSDLK